MRRHAVDCAIRSVSLGKIYHEHLEKGCRSGTSPRMASQAVHPYRWRFRLIRVGRFSDAIPAGEDWCGVEASGAGEIGISFSWARAVAGVVVDGDGYTVLHGCLVWQTNRSTTYMLHVQTNMFVTSQNGLVARGVKGSSRVSTPTTVLSYPLL
jgi:hypothetical protein